MGDFECDYKRCNKKVVYELIWDSYEDDGRTPVGELDSNCFAYSCNSLNHLVFLVKNHEFGPPVDDITFFTKMGKSKDYTSLYKLVKIVNEKVKKS